MKNIKADLHIHTNVSDGSYNFKEVIDESVKKNLTHISLTNHDTTLHQKEAIDYGKEKGITVITGIEISAIDNTSNKKVHILGYNYPVNTEILNDFCQEVLKVRNQNTIDAIKRLEDEGYKFDREAVIEKAKKSKCLYKQHLLEEIIDKGYTEKLYGEFYKEKIQKFSKECYVDVIDAIKTITSTGGVPVIAHIGLYNNFEELEKYVAAGIKGIECYHESHSEEEIEKIKKLAEKYNLFLTAGSDFHGDYGNETPLGNITIDFLDNSLIK